MSIEKKLTYLKNTKALIRKKLNRFGINVSSENTFRSYVDFLDEILNRYPKSRGQGTSITLENTIEAPFTIFDVEGNSEQETNLFDGQLSQGTLDSTGAEVDSVYRIRTTNYIEVVGGTTIPIRAQSSKEIQYLVYVFNNSKEVIETMGWNNINTSQTLQLNAKYIKLLFCHKDGSAISTSNVTNVVVGDTPNPNYEQPIKSAGDNENILPANNGSETIDGVNFTKNSDGTIIANGTATTGINYYINGLDYKNIPAGEYTLSDGLGTSGGESSNTFFTFLDGGPNSNSTISLPTFTLSQATNVRGRIVIRSGVTLDNVVFKPKLEKGNKASGYSPYGMGSINEKITNADGTQEQDYSIFVQQPMRSIGDVRDCFVKKSDGKLYERHLPYIASYNGETLPQDVYNEVDNVKYCNEKSMSTTGQFSIGASVQYIDENNWNDLPCTPEQIQQLENLPSTYKDFTTINSEDETPAYLEVAGLKED